jgi:hypothetical protein
MPCPRRWFLQLTNFLCYGGMVDFVQGCFAIATTSDVDMVFRRDIDPILRVVRWLSLLTDF